MKKIKIIFLAILLVLLTIPQTASAGENVDTTRTGSISVTMTYKGKAVSGGSLTIYRVAESIDEEETCGFEYIDAWKECEHSLDNIQSSKLAGELSKYAENKKIKGLKKEISKNGTVKFENLQTGLYLFIQEEAAEGYNEVNSFLATLPIREGESWVYDVDASPKVEVEKADIPTQPTTPSKPTGSRLPQTGQLNWPVPVLAISGLLLFAFGWFLCFIKKEKIHEK